MGSPIENTGIPVLEQSNSPDKTFNIGQLIAAKILGSPSWNTDNPNIVIALTGELGSGKTRLAKGIAAGFGITECVTSPTYTIINEYEINFDHEPHEHNECKYTEESILRPLSPPAPCPLYHIDAYRLNNEEEFINIGGPEIISSNGICVIEWADKIKNLLPKNSIAVNIKITGTDSRTIEIIGVPSL